MSDPIHNSRPYSPCDLVVQGMGWFQGQRPDTDASVPDVERVLTRAPHTSPRSSVSMVPGAMAIVGPKT